MKYFDSPKAAVERIRGLLEARDWAGLTCYYDLRGSGIAPDELRSGRFFYDPDDEVGHPSSRGWLRPFPPSYSYGSHEVEGDVAVVRVSVEVDEGDGRVSRSFTTFRLRRYPEGWRLFVSEAD